VLKNKNDEYTLNTHTGSSNRKHVTGGSLVDSVERSLFASHLANPRAETDTHYVSMAFHESLDVAEKEALLDMIRCVIYFTLLFIIRTGNSSENERNSRFYLVLIVFYLINRWLHELTGVKTTDLYRTASLGAFILIPVRTGD
jgi:hypothetical protein